MKNPFVVSRPQLVGLAHLGASYDEASVHSLVQWTVLKYASASSGDRLLMLLCGLRCL